MISFTNKRMIFGQQTWSYSVAKTEFLLIGSQLKLTNLDSKPSVNIGYNSIN
jgi:hypothetical protein